MPKTQSFTSPSKSKLRSPYDRLLHPHKSNKPPSQRYPGRNGYGPAPAPALPLNSGEPEPSTYSTPSTSRHVKRRSHGDMTPHIYVDAHFPWWPREIPFKNRTPLEVPNLEQGLDECLVVHRRDGRKPINLSHYNYLTIHQHVEVRMLNMVDRTWHIWQQGIIMSKHTCSFFIGYGDITCYQVQITGTTEKRQTAYCSVLSFAGEIRESRALPHPNDFVETEPLRAVHLLNSFYTVFAPVSHDDKGGPIPHKHGVAVAPVKWLPARIVSNFARDEPTTTLLTVVFHPAFKLPYRDITTTKWARRTLADTTFPCPWPDSAHRKGQCDRTCIVDQVKSVYPYTRRSISMISVHGVPIETIPAPRPTSKRHPIFI